MERFVIFKQLRASFISILQVGEKTQNIIYVTPFVLGMVSVTAKFLTKNWTFLFITFVMGIFIGYDVENLRH